MFSVNIHDAKTYLSKYLVRIAKGETILLCRRNSPIAEIRPIRQAKCPYKTRPIGLAKGRVTVPSEFFESLPDELLDAFEGKA